MRENFHHNKLEKKNMRENDDATPTWLMKDGGNIYIYIYRERERKDGDSNEYENQDQSVAMKLNGVNNES
jgi:hypothetical protein